MGMFSQCSLLKNVRNPIRTFKNNVEVSNDQEPSQAEPNILSKHQGSQCVKASKYEMRYDTNEKLK